MSINQKFTSDNGSSTQQQQDPSILTIPYNKAYRAIAKTVTGAILFQQLEYRFKAWPNGFYKYLEKVPANSSWGGVSWLDELGFSLGEFRTAFDIIGIRYKSKGEYEMAKHKFTRKDKDDKDKEFFYCSYFDRIKGITWYFRNHKRVESALDELARKWERPVSVNDESSFTDTGNPHLHHHVNNNNKQNKENNRKQSKLRSASADPLEKYPKALRPDIQNRFDYWRRTCQHEKAILDEVRANAVAKALARYSAEYIDLAILGASVDPWLQGKEDGQKKNDSLSLILRDSDHIERYAAIGEAYLNNTLYTKENGNYPIAKARMGNNGGALSASERNAINDIQTEYLLSL